MPYSSCAYCLFYVCVGSGFVCDGNEHVELHVHVEFQDRPQTPIDRAHKQDGNFHDCWRQNGDAFTSAAIQGGLSMHTTHTIIYSC